MSGEGHSFGEATAFGEGAVEQELLAPLPRGKVTTTSQMISELEIVFGPEGEMPAMRLG